MATKLCCTADQDGRPSSPDLPNVRVSEATPAKRPLLPKRHGSQGSRFTSARSEDLHELRQIFNSAKDPGSKDSSPTKSTPSRLTRPSVYSLHSLHKIKSVHALLKRKLSKDLSKKPSNARFKENSTKQDNTSARPDTVVKNPIHGPNAQLKITKADLRKDLLSDKKAEEGGYDSDAEVLDDVAKKIGKRLPSKRPSLHSIDWTSSPGSKQTPDSAKSYLKSSDAGPPSKPYQLDPSELAGNTPATSRFSNVFSTPDLRLDARQFKDRKLRRSHSATSFGLPAPSPFSVIRLPSMTTTDASGVPWSVSMHESLRLSQFPLPPAYLTPKPSRTSLRGDQVRIKGSDQNAINHSEPLQLSTAAPQGHMITGCEKPRIHVQEPTASPRPSRSIKKSAHLEKPEQSKPGQHEDDEENPRRSVHLYSMRISHHLRSGSLLSWDNLANAPDVPNLPRPFRDRTVSDQSRVSQQAARSRRDRQTSSSGFGSSGVPSKWGRVLPTSQQREEMSSIYSSRPHSPPESFGGSVVNASFPASRDSTPRDTVLDLSRSQSDAYPTDNEATPKPVKPHAIPNSQSTKRNSRIESLVNDKGPARNNSVANTKKSKFREEFSPSPPRKRSVPGMSFMKILRPRNSARSHSEADLKTANAQVDGPFDPPRAATRREVQLSRSVMSLQKEQQALGKDKEASPMWERALKGYQDERSSFFLPQNKNLTVQGSPFRERSGSIHSRPKSSASLSPLATREGQDLSPTATQAHTPVDADQEPTFEPKLLTRRSAVVRADSSDLDATQKLQVAFDKQTDTAETVGAWGRYPSHTRPGRTGSAGQQDLVQARDFALEAAIQFAKGDDNIDPTTRPESPPSTGGKKRKKRVGSNRMAKSHSMTFTKTFLKNYSRMFRSQSTEFQRHGHGHRSSVTTGGTLEYPELEIIPDVWRRAIVEDRQHERSKEETGAKEEAESFIQGNSKAKGKQRADDSMATLRPIKTDGGNLGLDGVADKDTPTDRARVWSVYYEDCIEAFPRLSTDLNSLSHPNLNELAELQGFGARHSIDSKRQSMHSRTLPARLKHHSRNGSHMSRTSVLSGGSKMASCVSLGEDNNAGGDGADKNSMVGVRRSTLDLISKYREQEVTERERVLSLMRAESVIYRGHAL